MRCGLVLAAAMLTRYDYWFLAAIIALAVVLQLFVQYRDLGLVRYKREVRQKRERVPGVDRQRGQHGPDLAREVGGQVGALLG